MFEPTVHPVVQRLVTSWWEHESAVRTVSGLTCLKTFTITAASVTHRPKAGNLDFSHMKRKAQIQESVRLKESLPT